MALIPRYSQDHVTNFQHRRTDFTLSIFKEDFIRIGNFVSKIPHVETGGNLFGLWTNQGNAVVLVATGPGKNCKRTSASFYQDIPYMQRVGDLLTTEYPLCHMGEWHSHHQMQLFQPSIGDCNTIQRNYPRGSQGFVLMIANILRDGTVRLSPYKFTDERSSYEIGKIELISAENPFMKVGNITRTIDFGKEDRIPLQHSSGGETVGDCQGAKYPPYSKDDHQNRARRGGSWSRGRSRSRSPIKKNHDDLSADEEERETRRPRRQKETPTPKRVVPSCRSSDEPRHEPFGQENYPSRDHTPQWYETETDITKRTMAYATTLADDPGTVKVSRDKITLNLTITFTHHYYDWSIEFPADFPRGSARLQQKYNTHSLSVRGQGNIHSFEKALESTLQEHCTTCMRVVSSNVASPSRHQQGETQVVQWYDKQPSTLERTIDIVTSLADGKDAPCILRDKSTNKITLEFKHHGGKWAVEFPPNFPTGNVKLKTKINGSNNTFNSSYRYSTSYSYTNSSPLSCTVEARGDVNIFKGKLQSALRQYCVKCRRYSQSNRFTRSKYVH